MTDKIPSAKQLSRLPKWARNYISKLEREAAEDRARIERLQEMMPWSRPGMSWFTLFAPPHREDREIVVFTCSEAGTKPIATLGRLDYLFVGRSKERDL